MRHEAGYSLGSRAGALPVMRILKGGMGSKSVTNVINCHQDHLIGCTGEVRVKVYALGGINLSLLTTLVLSCSSSIVVEGT